VDIAMTRLFINHPIAIHLDSADHPIAFTWQGRQHRWVKVVQHWQVDTDWWTEEGRIWREYWAVMTVDGLFCVVFRDLEGQGWYLAKLYD
jgi:hypothetical protein